MGGMAVQAADIAIGMGRLAEVSLLLSAPMTTEATCACLPAREILEADDLVDVPAALDVTGPGSVTVLAAVLALFDKRDVARTLKVLAVDIVMAALTRVRSDVGTGRGIGGSRSR